MLSLLKKAVKFTLITMLVIGALTAMATVG